MGEVYYLTSDSTYYQCVQTASAGYVTVTIGGDTSPGYQLPVVASTTSTVQYRGPRTKFAHTFASNRTISFDLTFNFTTNLSDFQSKTVYISYDQEDSIENIFDILLESEGLSSVVNSINGQVGDVEIATGGSVNSVGLDLPDIFTITEGSSTSPITVSGTLTAELADQTQNKVLAAPSGATGTPSFRTLVAADIPSLNYLPITGGTLLDDLTIGINGTGSPLTSKNITFQYGDSTAPTEVDLRVDALGVLRFGSGIVVSNATAVGNSLVSGIQPSDTIRFIKINADETVTALNASDFRTAIGAVGSDTNTTYTIDALDSGTNAIIRLSGSDITTDDITLVAGTNVTITPTDASNITIAATDTNTWQANTNEQDGYVTSGSGEANKVWKTDANGLPAWRDDAVGPTYSAATSSTLGLVKIGFTDSGKNYAVELNASNQMYVNVPWSDTNTEYSDFVGASLDPLQAGTAGLVPAPGTADLGKFLKGDGT